jgi:hypothetical protein
MFYLQIFYSVAKIIIRVNKEISEPEPEPHRVRTSALASPTHTIRIVSDPGINLQHCLEFFLKKSLTKFDFSKLISTF